ncbi:MAG: hypothetical protein IJ224_04125 [Lachnospiraceae bacterium]|nr:hypothetical protein [Lachnospiraceae bacterium]
MIVNIKYDDELVRDVILDPEENEDEDKLYVYSQLLNVENPALDFTRRAKKGEFNDLTDEEYEFALKRIEFISDFFFKKMAKVNIFLLTADLLRYVMKSIDEPTKFRKKEKE